MLKQRSALPPPMLAGSSAAATLSPFASASSMSASSATASASETLQKLARNAPQLYKDYPFTLNFYSMPPGDEVTLLEFETFALDRLRVLRAFETARLRVGKPLQSQSGSSSNPQSGQQHQSAGIGAAKDDAFSKLVEPVMAKYLDVKHNTVINTLGPAVLHAQRRKDHISHFILRLAYCRTEELRQWFLRQEVALFKYRFDTEPKVDRDAFVQLARLDFTAVSVEDMFKERLAIVVDEPSAASSSVRNEVYAKLLADVRSTYGIAPAGSASASASSGLSPQQQQIAADLEALRGTVFYRVPFEQVVELVSRRSVLIIGGSAFVPEHDRAILVVNAFRDNLMANLIATAKALPRLDEDDRLIPVLDSLGRQHMGNDSYGANSARPGAPVRHEDVDGLAMHFPPCMLTLHQSLRQAGHLKHFGRLQFSLFLKGIGLPVEEALLFWRRAFHKLTEEEYRKKGYAYGVRYNYGMEGKRTNYTPYSCLKIIMSMSPGAGDAHGCPFKHFSADALGGMMARMQVDDGAGQDVLRLARDGHYQLACTRLYEVSRGRVHALATAAHQAANGGSGGDAGSAAAPQNLVVEPIEHPNQWFDMSLASVAHLAGGGNAAGAAGVASTVNASTSEMAIDG
ncbi:eukaryotic and archaeal DNA primase, large subunit-domain-containing protein [Entophlyctis helioformis]|nr:eukaryotic and archaeal DNA primase, large subunit-domain-containing protein [Entophlyctis helioformis]